MEPPVEFALPCGRNKTIVRVQNGELSSRVAFSEVRGSSKQTTVLG